MKIKCIIIDDEPLAISVIENHLKNPLLNLLLETTVKEIIIENEVAIGVVIVNRFGEEEKIFANKEVILSGGSINSPQLLLLSGIGPADHLKEKGISLPLVFALNQASDSEQRKMINHINNDEKLKEVVAFVKASGGIEYAQKVMQKYRQEASEILQSLPASDARKSLEDLVDYVIERKR